MSKNKFGDFFFFFFFFYHVYHVYVQNVHLNFHLNFCLPRSALCTSFPRRMSKLAMEVLKWSSLLRDVLPRLGSPDKGGRTCQSIPTKRKEKKKSKRHYKGLWTRKQQYIAVCIFYINFYLITKFFLKKFQNYYLVNLKWSKLLNPEKGMKYSSVNIKGWW